MSDLAAAAAATGIPEELLQRAADARAAADGTPVDDLLAAWAGGAPAPAAAAAAPDPAPAAAQAAPADEPAEEAAPAAAPAAAPSAAAAPTATAVAAPPGGRATPVLEAQGGNPLGSLLAILGLFVLGLVVALVIPSNTGGDYNHLVPDAQLSATGEAGLDVYLSEGCWYCHTQLVRPVLGDVGLGPVVETFSDNIDTAAFGLQRLGPDLAHIGSRASSRNEDGTVTASELTGLLTTPDSESLHPSYGYLSDSDLDALVTYLLELK